MFDMVAEGPVYKIAGIVDNRTDIEIRRGKSPTIQIDKLSKL